MISFECEYQLKNAKRTLGCISINWKFSSGEQDSIHVTLLVAPLDNGSALLVEVLMDHILNLLGKDIFPVYSALQWCNLKEDQLFILEIDTLLSARSYHSHICCMPKITCCQVRCFG